MQAELAESFGVDHTNFKTFESIRNASKVRTSGAVQNEAEKRRTASYHGRKGKLLFFDFFFFCIISWPEMKNRNTTITQYRGISPDIHQQGCPRGVMVKSDGLRNRSERVRTPVALLRSLSGKYPWERYEPPYPPSYGLNSTISVLLGEWLWH